MRSRMSRRDLLSALAAGLAPSCALIPDRHLDEVREVYGLESQEVRDRVRSLVVVPGIMGSELRVRTTGTVVWGRWRFDLGAAGKRLSDADVPVLSLPVEEGTPLRALSDELVGGSMLHYVQLDFPGVALWINAYAGVFAGLLRQLVSVDTHGSGPVLLSHDELPRSPFFGFGYDWRRDLGEVLVQLDRVVDRAVALRGGPVPLLGHSMGGLLVRHYLRYGAEPLPDDGTVPPPTWAGARKVSTAILAGPPSLGSSSVLLGMMSGKTVDALLPRYPPTVLATMPSSYQLLPRVRHGALRWEGSGEPIDFMDVATWQEQRWGPFAAAEEGALKALLPGEPSRARREVVMADHMDKCFRRAKQFHSAMDRAEPAPPGLREHLLVGVSTPTASVYEVNRRTGALRTSEWWSGDGMVSRASALLDERGGRSRRDRPYALPPEATAVRFLAHPHESLLDAPSVLDELLFLALQ